MAKHVPDLGGLERDNDVLVMIEGVRVFKGVGPVCVAVVVIIESHERIPSV